jgi:hypothetical protein
MTQLKTNVTAILEAERSALTMRSLIPVLRYRLRPWLRAGHTTDSLHPNRSQQRAKWCSQKRPLAGVPWLLVQYSA